MDEREVIRYWLISASRDFETAEILYKNKRFHHALFFCHLSIEKKLKAIIVKVTKGAPPLIHDLVRLAERSRIPLTKSRKDDLAELTTFNVETRYDDHKFSFYKKADKKFSTRYFEKAQRIMEWLSKFISEDPFRKE